jgi:hypothetical protein
VHTYVVDGFKKMSLLLNFEKVINGSNVDNLTYITNLQTSWVCSKSMQNLLFYGFVLVTHECRALFKHESRVYNFHV